MLPVALTPAASPAELEAITAATAAAIATAWPGLAPELARFAVALRERFAALPLAEFQELRLAELWLAWAAADGDAAATALVDAEFVRPLVAVLRRTGLLPDQIEDALQEIRVRLLVGDGRPRLLDYAGRADLRAWMRTVAVRMAIDLQRKRREAPADEDELLELPAIAADPELQHAKALYRREFAAAATAAIAAAPARDRLLLKMSHLDGASIDQIGQALGVHRATAARWITAARDGVAERTRALLQQQLGVGASTLRYLGQLVESGLELSIGRLLAAP